MWDDNLPHLEFIFGTSYIADPNLYYQIAKVHVIHGPCFPAFCFEPCTKYGARLNTYVSFRNAKMAREIAFSKQEHMAWQMAF